MNYSILSQNISIVILGKFVPESIDPIWMVKNNILAIEDLENGFKSSPEMLFFRTRKFEVLINRDRLQVVSFSISDSDLICDFVIKLLMCKKSEELKAVGMNSQKIFSLLSDFDMLNFCHHFAPLDALTPISYNSLMLNMEWQSWEEDVENEILIGVTTIFKTSQGENLPNKNMLTKHKSHCAHHYITCNKIENKPMPQMDNKEDIMEISEDDFPGIVVCRWNTTNGETSRFLFGSAIEISDDFLDKYHNDVEESEK